jgi:hypothetical protein
MFEEENSLDVRVVGYPSFKIHEKENNFNHETLLYAEL